MSNSVDRRTFIKGMAAVSAVTAGSAAAPGGLLAARRLLPAEAAAEPAWKRAPCNLCGVGCGLLVGIEGGRAVAVRGDPDSPVSQGLACAKGYYAVQTLYSRDRISRAMIRRGGRLVQAPVGEALDLVARTLRDTTARYGPASAAVYGSNQWSVADAHAAATLFRRGIGTNNVDSGARLSSAAAIAGMETSFGLPGAVGCYDDVEHADVFVLWDVNLAETDPVLFSRMLERRRRDPAVRIVDLTTRTTRTSYAATRSLLHAPHSAPAIANAICHEIVARRWTDRAFVDRHTAFARGRADIGYGADTDAVVPDTPQSATWDDYMGFLAAYTPERAHALSGLGADSIRWLASLYGDPARRVMTVWGASLSQHARGTWMNNLLYNIHLLVGKIGSPGNGALCMPGEMPGVGAPPDRAAAQSGLAGLGLFRALDRGDVRFLWIQGGDPMSELPNLVRYRAAARKADRFIVASAAYPSATTELADVVLPSALWVEREGVLLNGERHVQHFDRLVAPPGDAMSDAWQMVEVGRRLGFRELLPWGRDSHAAEIWDDYRRLHDNTPSAMPAAADLRARSGVAWPVAAGGETKRRYATAHDPAASPARGAFDFYGYPDGRARIWLRPHEPPAELPDREYPFLLNAGAVLKHSDSGTLTRRVPTLLHAVPRAYVEMHADDAQRIGVRNRETVRLVSRRGAVEIEVRVDYRSRPSAGQLFVPAFDGSAPVRGLMPDAFCPLSGQPELATSAVRVERLRARGGS